MYINRGNYGENSAVMDLYTQVGMQSHLFEQV